MPRKNCPLKGVCIQGDCGWWDEHKEACSMKLIAVAITSLDLKYTGKRKPVTDPRD